MRDQRRGDGAEMGVREGASGIGMTEVGAAVPVVLHERVVLRKFDGDVPHPPPTETPAEEVRAAGFPLVEEVEIEDGDIVRRQSWV